MIQTAVENMHQLDQILPAVRDLGRRHAGYGVKAADYDTVAGALLGTLEHALGPEFTPAVRDAWLAYYQSIAAEMINCDNTSNACDDGTQRVRFF